MQLKEPKVVRVVHEGLYAGVFVILLLWLTAPFNVETIHEGRSLFFFAQGIITTLVSITTGTFSTSLIPQHFDLTLFISS